MSPPVEPAPSEPTPPVPPELADLLATWLPGQRWFAGKGRSFSIDRVIPLGTLTEYPYPSAIYLAQVRYDDTRQTEMYQVPLVQRRTYTEGLAHVLVGRVADKTDGQLVWWYDALHDKEVTGAWLARIAEDYTDGTLTFRRGPGVADLPLDEPSLVLTSEQSNTSLVFGDVAILKVFRRVYPGLNPDIEVHEALSELPGGARHVSRLLGSASARWVDPDGFEDAASPGAPPDASLAMLQEFFRTATDGWELAKTSVRDLYAEADLHADEVGGDFAGEAHRLGVATAEVHADLARALPTGILDRPALIDLAGAMRARLEIAISSVPELAEFRSTLGDAYDALAAHPGGVLVQRIHGDYHLGQVLRTVHRWVVLDFEGEPSRPLAERVALHSPMRDVAGMLRSFDYAARHLLADHPFERQIAYRADEWAERNQRAFCDGYAEASGQDPRADGVLLRAYEADKAVYEAVYEARNRPSWLQIPMSSLARLTTGAAP